MKLNKFAYLYSKPLGNYALKIMKKTWKFTEKPGKIMEFCQSEKVGTLYDVTVLCEIRMTEMC